MRGLLWGTAVLLLLLAPLLIVMAVQEERACWDVGLAMWTRSLGTLPMRPCDSGWMRWLAAGALALSLLMMTTLSVERRGRDDDDEEEDQDDERSARIRRL